MNVSVFALVRNADGHQGKKYLTQNGTPTYGFPVFRDSCETRTGLIYWLRSRFFFIIISTSLSTLEASAADTDLSGIDLLAHASRDYRWPCFWVSQWDIESLETCCTFGISFVSSEIAAAAAVRLDYERARPNVGSWRCKECHRFVLALSTRNECRAVDRETWVTAGRLDFCFVIAVSNAFVEENEQHLVSRLLLSTLTVYLSSKRQHKVSKWLGGDPPVADT